LPYSTSVKESCSLSTTPSFPDPPGRASQQAAQS